ncbi:hypothetical protein SDC9_174771 [bioreactor metagenome]|uniref:Uncharacterized protein n=1 Tax=bioreactor metagenome TaxID=1076179 RepID=A0A645GME2_9ZZZZ
MQKTCDKDQFGEYGRLIEKDHAQGHAQHHQCHVLHAGIRHYLLGLLLHKRLQGSPESGCRGDPDYHEGDNGHGILYAYVREYALEYHQYRDVGAYSGQKGCRVYRGSCVKIRHPCMERYETQLCAEAHHYHHDQHHGSHRADRCADPFPLGELGCSGDMGHVAVGAYQHKPSDMSYDEEHPSGTIVVPFLGEQECHEGYHLP